MYNYSNGASPNISDLLIPHFHLLFISLKEGIFNFLVAPAQRFLDNIASLLYHSLCITLKIGLDKGINLDFAILCKLWAPMSIKYTNCKGIY